MRPKKNVIVVGIRPELRFMLRIAGRVRVWPVEAMPELRQSRGIEIDAVIVDYRDAPTLARRVVKYLRRFPIGARTILIASSEEQKHEPVCDITVRNGRDFYGRLLSVLWFALARKRGPARQFAKDGAEWATVPRSVSASR